MSILRLIISSVLRFFYSKAEEWYQQELRYRENKRIIIGQVEEIVREAAKENTPIRVDVESIDDSLLRLERWTINRDQSRIDDSRSPVPITFANFKRGRNSGDSGGDQQADSGEQTELSGSDDGGLDSDSDDERPRS